MDRTAKQRVEGRTYKASEKWYGIEKGSMDGKSPMG